MRSGYGSAQSLKYRIDMMKKIREKFKPSGMVLDIGCGIGNFVDLYDEKYIGVDFVYEPLREHRYKYGKTVVVGDAQSLPFKSELFSFASAVEVAQYMEDHKAFICEISRILKKDGIAVIISPNPSSLFWLIRQKIKGISPLNFVSLSDLLTYGKDLKIQEINGIFPIPLWNSLDRLLRFIPLLLRVILVVIFSKSFVLVLRKNKT